MSGRGAVTEVRPRPGLSGRPDAYTDRTVLLIAGSELVVRDLRGREYRFPLRGEPKAKRVAAMVLTRARYHDKTGDHIFTRLELVNAHRHTVCRLPGWGWDQEQLAALAHTAGLPFSVDTLSDQGYDNAYPMIEDAVEIPSGGEWVSRLILMLFLVLTVGLCILAVVVVSNA